MNRLLSIFCLLLLPYLVACQSDDEVLPAYRQELAELFTDGEGNASHLLLDDGSLLRVDGRFQTSVADSVFRVQALFTTDGGTATLHSAATVFAALPATYPADRRPADPVAVTAAWQAGRYINLRLRVQTGGGQQLFGFHAHALDTLPDGSLRQRIDLLHSRNDDPAFYSAEVLASVPLWPYREVLRPGRDSVTVVIPTDRGGSCHTYAFPQAASAAPL